MELATGKERTIDGIAAGGRIALGHPKTREAMRAGLAMYFETLDDPGLMETAGKIVAELGLDHFFNIQLVGEHVIEINPRISTIVYQEDLNLPYLGVKHALGEISEEELGALAARIRPDAAGAALLRPGRVGRREWDLRSNVHCPVNTAGVPWTNVQALRRGRRRKARRLRALQAPPGGRLVARPARRLRPPAADAVARARPAAPADRRLPLLLRAHARPEVAPVPDPARARQEVGLPLPRLGHPRQDARRARLRASAPARQIVGSYDAIRWVPEAEVVPPGIDLARVHTRCRPPTATRPVVVHAPSSRRRKGTEHVIAACEQLPADLEIVEGLHHDEAFERYANADIVVDQLNAGWYGLFAIEGDGARQAGRHLPPRGGGRAHRGGLRHRVPIVSATAETLRERLRPLVESAEERRRIGAESRAYVERVHDADRIADRLLDVYARL